MKLFLKTVICIYLSSISCCFANVNPISYKKVELDNISNKIQDIKSALSQDQQQQTDLHEQLKAIELMLATLSEQIGNINQSLQMEQQKLVSLREERKINLSKLNHQHEALAMHIRSAYCLGNINEVKIILNQQNPNTLSRYLGYYRYLTEQRLMLIADIKKTILTLTQNMVAITQHQNSLRTLLEEKTQQHHYQLDAQKLRQALITEIARESQSKQQELSSLLANQQALQAAIQELQMQTDDILNTQSFTALQGKLHWPTKGAIAASFGSALEVGDQRLTGVIIKAPIGAPVKAIAAGKIIFANWLRGFGLLVIINHGNGYMSLYARNQSLQVKVGKIVHPGEIIATLGNTGGFTSSGLYFEIRQNGIPINPSIWCRYT